MKKGQVYEGIIESVEFPNKGRIYVPEEDRWVVVKNGVPGQKVRFSVNKIRKGKAEGSDINLLEMNFSRERDNAFIQSLTDSVKGFEYRSLKQAEALERARLLDEQAKHLKEQANKLGKP